MGLGQRHGAEEAAIDHRLQKAFLLLFATKVLDQVGGAHGQHGVGRRCRVGRLEMREAGL